MMENKENIQENSDLINKLVGEGTSSQELPSISSGRVVAIRYKLYVVVLLFLVVFGITDYVLPSFDKYQNLRSQLENMKIQTSSFDIQKAAYESDKQFIELVDQQEALIVSCLNTKTSCDQINEKLRDKFTFARDYIQLNNLYDQKMQVNEKIILANINEYLLKRNFTDGTQQRIGSLKEIALGDSSLVVHSLYLIPVKLSIVFDTRQQLVSFLENVEKRVVENKAYRVLYKIKEVNYDITRYDQSQQVDVYLSAYYYQE